jgi:very-short-patch-repair endonuclease
VISQHRQMTWVDAFVQQGLIIASRAQLRSVGASDRGLTSAVRSGELIRVRRDHYALPGCDRHIVRAVRVGGRLACSSRLRSLGVFAFDDLTHIHMTKQSSRSRSPLNRHVALSSINRDGAILHWAPLLDARAGTEYAVGVLDALAQVVRCNHPWHAIASIDNAIFLRRIDEADLAELFAWLPEQCQPLRALVDGRSEAGQETVLRCAFREAGLEPELQVVIPEVGRVDLVLEGRLIIEADSRSAHDGWELHVRDRDRDIDAARQGYMTLRPAYRRTMFATADVVEAALMLLRSPRDYRR